MEDIKAVRPPAVHHSRVELPERGVQLHSDRMRVRQSVVRIIYHKGDMKGVSRSPDAAFSVDKAFESLFHLLPSCVEPAERLLVAVSDLEIAYGFAGTGRDGKRHSGDFHVGKSPAVSHGLPDNLQLIVVDGHFRAFDRSCGQDIVDSCPYSAVSCTFGYDPDVGCHQVAVREARAVHIVGLGGRIVPVCPPVSVFIVAFVIIRGRGVPYELFFFACVRFQLYQCAGIGCLSSSGLWPGVIRPC